MIIKLLKAVLYFFSGFSPRDPKKIIFGAWLGSRFSDNPKYLLLYMAKQHPELDLIWIGEAHVGKMLAQDTPVRFARRGSFSAFSELLTAGYCFVTHSASDVARVNLLRGAVVTYLGHGVALKHMGSADSLGSGRILDFFRKLVRKPQCYNWFVASSDRHAEKLRREYAINGATTDKIIATGQPRIDFLIKSKSGVVADGIRAKIQSGCALPAGARIITYLPTFRDKRQRAFSFLSLEVSERQRLSAILETFNAVILEKSHFADAMREAKTAASGCGRIMSLVGGGIEVDTQELLLITDLLITDYSGCFLDFLLLDRPVLHFAYDREYYTKLDRGLYFDLDEAAAGSIVEDFASLCHELEQELRQPGRQTERRRKVCKSLMAFEEGDSCRRICQTVLDLRR